MNRAHLAKVLDEFVPQSHVVVDARSTDYVDPDVLALIREFADDQAPARGVNVSLFGFRDRYALDDRIQYVDFTTRELQESMTPDRVLRILAEGNQRFASGNRLKRDLVRQVDATSAGQHPMAIVLSCIDSRAPAELLFDLGIGDIFSARIAGNIAKEKVLGSMEFACKVAGSKLIVVLGHTSCGAVKATCDFVANGVDPAAATGLTNLPAITSVIAEAVRQETRTAERRDGQNPDFVDRVARINVENTMRWIRAHSPTLAAMLHAGEIGLVGGIYDVKTGCVAFFDGDNGSGVAQELHDSDEHPGR
jgi:carbonic anhydrase/SulP family sulfate permease